MKLSIFLAGIRTAKWVALYNSISRSTNLTDYELVIVSPYDLPPELENNPKVRLIKDCGCPMRCYQLGALHSQGEYVVWAGDDGTFSPTLAIDKGLEAIPKHNGVVAFSYSEGHAGQLRRAWWNLGYHRMLKSLQHIPNHYFLVMTGLMRRDYFLELGGFDCQFEHGGLGCVDFSVRMQRDGAQVVLGEKIQDLELQKGNRGDHGPIRAAHAHDKGVLHSIYIHKKSVNRTRINFDNWKQAEAVWSRRFPKGVI